MTELNNNSNSIGLHHPHNYRKCSTKWNVHCVLFCFVKIYFVRQQRPQLQSGRLVSDAWYIISIAMLSYTIHNQSQYLVKYGCTNTQPLLRLLFCSSVVQSEMNESTSLHYCGECSNKTHTHTHSCTDSSKFSGCEVHYEKGKDTSSLVYMYYAARWLRVGLDYNLTRAQCGIYCYYYFS